MSHLWERRSGRTAPLLSVAVYCSRAHPPAAHDLPRTRPPVNSSWPRRRPPAALTRLGPVQLVTSLGRAGAGRTGVYTDEQ